LSALMYGDFLAHHHPDQVLLTAHWSERDLPELEHTIFWLKQHGMKVTVFGQSMEYDTALPRVLFNSIRDRNPAEVQRHWMGENRDFDKKMAELARNKWKVHFISEFENLCGLSAKTETVDGCPLYAAPGVPIIFDSFHLTLPGSVLYAKSIRRKHQLQ
jgi:hypothetical protein